MDTLAVVGALLADVILTDVPDKNSAHPLYSLNFPYYAP